MSVNDDSPFVPDPLKLDVARRDVQEFFKLLEQEIYRSKKIEDTVRAAGIRPSTINWDQPSRWIWRDALDQAGRSGRLRLLLTKMAEDEDYNFIHSRIQGILAGAPAALVLSAKQPGMKRGGGWRGGKEAQTSSQRGLADIVFLDRAIDAAKSVFRLDVWMGGERSQGTGFLIGERRVLTNHHVLFDDAKNPAERVVLRTGYQMGKDDREEAGQETPALEGTIRGNFEHDWAVVDLAEPLAGVPVLKLGSSRKVTPGDFVSIVQHPFGGVKKIALFNNEVRFTDEDVIQYLTDTEAGASGAPVFNLRWEVVALHHAWVPATEEKYQVRNEGIAIGRVLEGLRKEGLLA